MCYQALTTFVWNIASTIVGGVVLAVLFFFAREKCFPLPKVAGRWHVEMQTINTTYNPYRGMVLQYVAMLWHEGIGIKGTIEKVYEDSTTGKRRYVGKNRTRGTIEGYIDKRYFSKDRIYLHIIEDGHGRQSTHFHDLLVKRSGRMTGTFSAMVASSEGKATWQREQF